MDEYLGKKTKEIIRMNEWMNINESLIRRHSHVPYLHIEEQWVISGSELCRRNTDAAADVGFLQNLLGQKRQSVHFFLAWKDRLKTPLGHRWKYRLTSFHFDAVSFLC